MSFSSEVKEEVKNKYFTIQKRHSKIFAVGPDAGLINFLTESFLNFGSVSDPEKMYRLEFVLSDRDAAEELSEKINLVSDVPCAKVTDRKDSFVVYIKDAEGISNFLSVLGAHKSMMAFENIRILKSMRENVQRQVNCETTNIRKTVNASVKQIADIEYIEKNLGFEKLPDSLREVAEVRLARPNATLSELSQSLYPPVGKSGVNHRLRKLSRIADELRAGNDQENLW